MNRQSAVAGQFYEGDPARLRQNVAKLMPAQTKTAAKLLIVPHAGYVYSGRVAGATFARTEVPETVVLLGPNHHGLGAPLAVSSEDWETPLGHVPLARELAAALVKGSKLFAADNLAHQREHSLEVQLPFLQVLQDKLRIVPIAVSRLPLPQCRQAGAELARALRSFAEPALLVASTDMTHYEPRQQAAEKDQLALGHILSLDPAGLHGTVLTQRITMCGVIPVTIALFAALELGAEHTELVCHADSGYVSGDTGQVVGYAGLLIR